MAVTCGFFNSVEGDRKYDATQFASLFDGVITDGVVAAVGEFFATTPGGGMNVKVGTGRAWFNRTWTYSDSKVPLTIPASDLLYDRIDAVVLEVDTRIAVRNNSIKVVKGTAASKPSNPPLTNTTDVHQYALAYVRVKHGATTIGAGDITINVGQPSCPFVTSIVETPELDALFARWDAQFQEWFNNIQAQLEGNIATNLQNQINQRVKIADKASGAEVKAGALDTKWVTPKGIADAFGFKAPKNTVLLHTATGSVLKEHEISLSSWTLTPDIMLKATAIWIDIEFTCSAGSGSVNGMTVDLISNFEAADPHDSVILTGALGIGLQPNQTARVSWIGAVSEKPANIIASGKVRHTLRACFLGVYHDVDSIKLDEKGAYIKVTRNGLGQGDTYTGAVNIKASVYYTTGGI